MSLVNTCPSSPLAILILDKITIPLSTRLTDTQAEPETFVDAQRNLPEVRGLSLPASPSSSSGTSLALSVFDHITDSLPQWLVRETSLQKTLQDPEFSLRNVKASARNSRTEHHQNPKPHQDQIVSNSNLDTWGYRIDTNIDRVESARKTLNLPST